MDFTVGISVYQWKHKRHNRSNRNNVYLFENYPNYCDISGIKYEQKRSNFKILNNKFTIFAYVLLSNAFPYRFI
jgi:hypothetical protein